MAHRSIYRSISRLNPFALRFAVVRNQIRTGPAGTVRIVRTGSQFDLGQMHSAGQFVTAFKLFVNYPVCLDTQELPGGLQVTQALQMQGQAKIGRIFNAQQWLDQSNLSIHQIKRFALTVPILDHLALNRKRDS
jgi:hypothetical protein